MHEMFSTATTKYQPIKENGLKASHFPDPNFTLATKALYVLNIYDSIGIISPASLQTLRI